MDLKDAFHQIPLEPESRLITGTSTPLGLQQWCVVVMGWKNGVQYCQRNVETVLEPVSDIAAGYVDDISEKQLLSISYVARASQQLTGPHTACAK